MFDLHNTEFLHIFDSWTLYFYLGTGVQIALGSHDFMFSFFVRLEDAVIMFLIIKSEFKSLLISPMRGITLLHSRLLL